MPRTTIELVAEAFLSLESMSNKKLQKLCYYAYAWFLVLHNNDLFCNRFQAWVHGPVDPSLYRRYRDYGWDDIPQGSRPVIDSDIFGFIEEVFAAYGEMNADELEYLTHREDPWISARGGLSEFASCSSQIDSEVIRSYYTKILETNQ